jgi:alkylation response protein AidB-like acyl-CoA dehydrogenase
VTGGADELELLRATVRGVLDSGAGLPELGELGLLGLLVPEVQGGVGWCPVEAVIVAGEIGRGTGDRGPAHGANYSLGVPWLEASLAAMALSAGGDAVRRDWLDPLLAGSRTVVLAQGDVALTTSGLSGAVTGVVGRPEAVVAQIGGSSVLIPRSSGGVTVISDPTSIDLTLPAETWILSAAVPLELDGPDPWPVDPLDVRRVLAAASLLGLLSAALERLVPYLSDRIAFGAHIASFQAVQHRIVDLFLLEVRSRVTVDAASRALAVHSERVGRLAAAAHGFVAAHVPAALDECIQLTGGIGFTWEYPLHHELRRAVALAASCGGAAESRRRFALAGDASG